MPSETRPEGVNFYATCLVDLFYPQVGLAGMALLKREGLKVIFPGDQTCYGQPACNAGYREQARWLAAAQLDLFAKDHPIVASSGSCAEVCPIRIPNPPTTQSTALGKRA